MKTRVLTLLLAGVGLVTTGAGKGEGRMFEGIHTGEFWYAMIGGEGHPLGYARLDVARPEGGGLTVQWELKLAYDGGNYEETRSMTLDAAGQLVAAEYRALGNLVGSARTDGGRWLVTTIRDGKPVEAEAKLPPDSMIGLGFVLAPLVPRKEGGRFERTELDEANGFEPIGTTSFTYVRHDERDWEGEKLAVDRILMKKANGKEMPVEVTADGRIVSSDWGGGNRMLLSKHSTKDLYRPAPPAIEVVETGPETLVMKGVLANLTPEAVFDDFTKKDRIPLFWAPVADVEPKVGGTYELEWPGPGWKLEGKIRVFEPGKKLAFTWKWAHRPEAPEQIVTIELAPAPGGGTAVTLTHGPYRDTEEDRRERKGHVDGWKYVFAHLRALAK